ncbi:MAG: GvpL/GvpF family gas vesicle protein [Elusimicrobiota bacterium]
MSDIYLYCIRDNTGIDLDMKIRGIDGKNIVYQIIYKDLAAIVSGIDPGIFNMEEIQKKAKDDLQWIKEKAVAHERVIEEVMKTESGVIDLIPMRFGAVFKGKISLKKCLKKDYAEFRKFLDKIRNRQEWSVKAYLGDGKKLEQIIIDKNRTSEKKDEESKPIPEGLAFFMEEELKDNMISEKDKEISLIAGEIFAGFNSLAEDSSENKVLNKALTGKAEPMISNTAYLIDSEKTGHFKDYAETLNNKVKEKGFYLEYSGPWPAYSFL